MKSRRRQRAKAVLLLLAVLIALICIWLITNPPGVTRSRIEADARSGQHIPADYQIVQDVSDSTAALLFYGDTADSHVVSIYFNYSGPDLGYHFHTGGSRGAIADSVAEFSLDGHDTALVSMNRPQVARIEMDNGQTIMIDSRKPFAVVIPRDSGQITLYDSNDQPVEQIAELM